MSLTAAEDADLRRLAAFDALGFLDAHGQMRLRALRARDRRLVVRDVDSLVERFPLIRPPAAVEKLCSVYPR